MFFQRCAVMDALDLIFVICALAWLEVYTRTSDGDAIWNIAIMRLGFYQTVPRSSWYISFAWLKVYDFRYMFSLIFINLWVCSLCLMWLIFATCFLSRSNWFAFLTSASEPLGQCVTWFFLSKLLVYMSEETYSRLTCLNYFSRGEKKKVRKMAEGWNAR